MDLINATSLFAAYTMGMKPSGSESIVVVVKGTFSIVGSRSLQPNYSNTPIPLVESDTFTGEPGLTAPIYEADFAPAKKKCDVILNGSAYAANGGQATQVKVSLAVGDMKKTFHVLGDRVWKKALAGYIPSQPQPFKALTINYDKAFGGSDYRSKNPRKHLAWMMNPVGCGFHNDLSKALVADQKVPNTQAINKPVESPNGDYQPMSFGPIGRGWAPRYQYAGTYDDVWFESEFPFLPRDFDERYYQSAPADQQIPYLTGGEIVTLENLTPEGLTSFVIPAINVPVVFFLRGDKDKKEQIRWDTLIIEPDLGVFSMVGRVNLPLKKSIFEVMQILVGEKSRAWWRARELGKTYCPTLDHLIAKGKNKPNEEDIP